MKRFLALAVMGFVAGCSNAPVAGFLDCVSPSKARPGISGDRPPPAGGDWSPAIPAGRNRDTLPPTGELPPPGEVRP